MWLDLQRSWVTECLTKFSLDFVLWRQVKLLKKLWRDRDATGGPDVLQCEVLINALVKVLVVVCASVPIS